MTNRLNSSALIIKKNSLKAWILATRPKTLPVSFVPVLIGVVFSSHIVDSLNLFLAICTLLCSLCIQIGTNLINDALDFKKGADNHNRLGPLRMTQNGLLSYKEVLMGGFLSFSLALLCGIPLILAGGWPLAIILMVSIFCGYLYTGGPYPLAYIGVSDCFILIFFGWVSTCATYYLQTGTISLSIFIASTQIGLLAMVPHAINNLRDHASDKLAKKNSLAVRFGPQFARWEITILAFVPFLIGMYWLSQGSLWMTFLPFISLIPIVKNVKNIWLTEPGTKYNQFLATSALCQLLFGVLLALGSLL
ncbi:MAG: 1,4-dihydroxy-2-naphthoate octaprenyltransferase [Parachlamydiaceae bacterium]|nr:1,4-dihydroxy-2-naphthoate octaprenyltransferase [Parachlamydiaceae bacterium]